MQFKVFLWALFLVLGVVASLCDRAATMDAERVAFYVTAGKCFYFELPFLRLLNFIFQIPSVLIFNFFQAMDTSSRLIFFIWSYTLAPLSALLAIDFFNRKNKTVSPYFLPILYLVAILPGFANQFSTVSEGVVIFALMMSFRDKKWLHNLGILALVFSHETSAFYLLYFMSSRDLSKTSKALSAIGLAYILFRVYSLANYLPGSNQFSQILTHPVLPVLVAFLLQPFLKKGRGILSFLAAIISLYLFVFMSWQDNIFPHAFRNLSALLAIATFESFRLGFEFHKRAIIILLLVVSFFDFSLSIAYKKIRAQNRLAFEGFQVIQTEKSKKDFLILLKEVEANRGFILRPFYASAAYPIDQLLFEKKK